MIEQLMQNMRIRNSNQN